VGPTTVHAGKEIGMTLVLTCWSCSHQTRLPASYLLVAAASPGAGAAGIVAWICLSCPELVVNSVDWTALATVVAGGAELVGGCPPATAFALDRRPHHPRKAF
jgi:hypothetical protein